MGSVQQVPTCLLAVLRTSGLYPPCARALPAGCGGRVARRLRQAAGARSEFSSGWPTAHRHKQTKQLETEQAELCSQTCYQAAVRGRGRAGFPPGHVFYGRDIAERVEVKWGTFSLVNATKVRARRGANQRRPRRPGACAARMEGGAARCQGGANARMCLTNICAHCAAYALLRFARAA